MTKQIAENLIVHDPKLDLHDLALRAVVTGDPSKNFGWGDGEYSLPLPPLPEGSVSCSALWRGYISTFVIHVDGSVELHSCQFPFASRAEERGIVYIGKQLTGDFWLVMSEYFGGPRTFIPARQGYVIKDRHHWYIEPPRDD